jgi:hypothetical protein
MAAGFFGELRSEGFLFVFEVVELHFQQFVMGQRLIEGSEEFRTETFFADLDAGFQPLSESFQIADLGVGQTFHSGNLTESRLNARKSADKAFLWKHARLLKAQMTRILPGQQTSLQCAPCESG